MGIPEDTAEHLAELGNMGLTKATWSNYRTAERMLERCRRDTGERMELPLKQEQVLLFIDWLSRKRKAKHGTICSYLAGIRQLQIARGMGEGKIRSDLVNLVLAGKRNKDVQEKKKGRKGRLPVTKAVMKLIKATLRKSSMSLERKRLVWAVCCLTFAGAFRIHEILAREERRFDPKWTLLNRDLKVVQDKEGKATMLVTVKWPKEDKVGKEIEVEVLESRTETCPVRAWRKWQQCTGRRKPDQPAFRLEDGRAFTGRKFNTILKRLLEDHIDYSQGSISAHSFRSGVTTELGRKGCTDEQLKEVGCWSSRAYEHYLKLPRTTRKSVARKIRRL